MNQPHNRKHKAVEDAISEKERQYLKKLFAPYGGRYIIMHWKEERQRVYLRVRGKNSWEREFGEIRGFLQMSPEQQQERIKLTLEEKNNSPK